MPIPFETRLPGRRLIEAWYDSPNAVPIFLALFVAVWTMFQIVSFWPADLHPDIVEVYGWGRHPAPGYYKHPPLGGLMTGAWFAIFPAQNWAAYLLAMCNAAAALFFIDLIARRYLSRDKRLMVLLLLLLTPFYQFHGVRFASNQTLLSTWPLAVWCFLRAFESRTVMWGLAAGAAAALAMLGKYYSVYLVAGLAIAALAHPDRMRYLRSLSPWASIVAGFAVLAPHLVWLAQTGYQPFGYAYQVHGARSPLGAVATVPGYVASAIGFVLVPLVVFWLATRPKLHDMVRALWPGDPDRRMLAILLWAPLLLPALTAPVVDVDLVGLWTMQGWFLLPILLLIPDSIVLTRAAAVKVAAGVAAFSLAALAAAPVLAYVKHRQGPGEGRAYYALLAQDLTQRWGALTGGRPLRIVMGEQDYAMAASFYAPDHPDSVPGFDLAASPWVTPERLRDEGFAAICLGNDCVNKAMSAAGGRPGLRREEATVSRRLFGMDSRPQTFTLVLAPPLPPPR